METQHKQRGFGFIGVLIALVVVGAIALIGLRVMDMRTENSSVVSSSSPTQTSVPAKIANKTDLQNAASALNSTNVDQVDLSQLDSDLSALL